MLILKNILSLAVLVALVPLCMLIGCDSKSSSSDVFDIPHRPVPDLIILYKNAMSKTPTVGECEIYMDIMKLGRSRIKEAVPVLGEILKADTASPDSHRALAIEGAVFQIGTPEAHRILSERLLRNDYKFDYTDLDCGLVDLRLHEPDRSRFISQYILANCANMELSVSYEAFNNGRDIEFSVSLKNISSKPYLVPPHVPPMGLMFFFREKDGTVIYGNGVLKCIIPRIPFLALEPQQSISYHINASVFESQRSRPKTISLDFEDLRINMYFELEPKQIKDVIVMLYISDKELRQMSSQNEVNAVPYFKGRAVSKPIPFTLAR